MNEFRMTAGCGLTRANLDYPRPVSSFLLTNVSQECKYFLDKAGETSRRDLIMRINKWMYIHRSIDPVRRAGKRYLSITNNNFTRKTNWRKKLENVNANNA